MVISKGFLLVQQMIALALALLFITLFGSILLQLWQAFVAQSQQVMLHQTAVQLQVLFQRELVNAKFWAGLKPQHIVPTAVSVDGDCHSAGDSGSFPRAGQAFVDLQIGWHGDVQMPACLRYAVPNSSFLQLKRLAATTSTPTNRLRVVQDGLSARFVTAGSVGAGSWSWPYLHEVYYVSHQTHPQGQMPVLMRKRLVLNTQHQAVMDTDSVLDGVEALAFSLGFDTDGDLQPDYFSQRALSAPDKVVIIRYWALIRAETRQLGYKNNNIYQLDNKQWQAPGDAFQRLLISSSVRLINGSNQQGE